ncbi:MAG: alpha/beta hydrolase [bacterium]
MPRLQRPDGAEINFEQHGSGPLVVLASYWSTHPSVFEPVTSVLEGDHRVVRYDDRGAGDSTRAGPYDLDTAAADLEALIDHLGEPVTIVSTADGSNRAVRVGARRPEIVDGIVAVGGVPLGREALGDSDSLVASDVVVRTLLQQVDTDYRGVLRSLLTATNPQMDEAELRERVAAQVAHAPAEAAAARLHAFAADEPVSYSLACGSRVWVLVADRLGGDWFPRGAEMARVVERSLPEARVVEVDDGLASRPDQTAEVVRRITAARRASAVEN